MKLHDYQKRLKYAKAEQLYQQLFKTPLRGSRFPLALLNGPKDAVINLIVEVL